MDGSIGVGVHRVRVRKLLDEVVEVVETSISDDGEGIAGAVDGVFRCNVVSNLLTAKHSAKVPDKDQDGGFVRPKEGSRNGVSVGINEGEVVEIVLHEKRFRLQRLCSEGHEFRGVAGGSVERGFREAGRRTI